MTKGDKVTVKRGPLSGMTVELVRPHLAANSWIARVDNDEPLVMVWNYELAETIERKKVKRGTAA